MNLENARVIVTGACGGIGQAIVRELLARGASVGMVDRQADGLQSLADELAASGAQVEPIIADLTDSGDRARILSRMHERFGGIDVLINNAGVMAFTEFAQQDAAQIEQTIKVNVTAPMALTHDVLPGMLERGYGRIVNVGSIFGSIAFAWYAAYSASKFALRGFSEALRRELKGSGVGVTYVAPRAVKTSLNAPEVYRMAEKVNMKMDDPQAVARRIVRAIERDREDVYLGFPEKLFVRLNAVLPRVVDKGLRRQNDTMREFLPQR